MKKVIGLLIFVMLLAVALLVGLLVYKNKVDGNARERDAARELLEASEIVEREWFYAMYDGKWERGELKCPELGDPKSTHPLFLRCNVDYLNCLYKDKNVHKNVKILLDSRGNIFSSYYSRMLKSGDNLPPGMSYGIGITLQDEVTKKRLKMFLEPTCHETVLPERVYGYGEFDSKRIDLDWRFDTFERKIAVDKFPVTISEINILRKAQNKDILNGEPAAPAINITAREQAEFCHFRGKRVLEAMYFDAMSFHPIDRDNPRIQILRRSPYPWSRISTESFLANKEPLTEYDCGLAYIKECQGTYQRKHYSPTSASWIGGAMLLGYDMEALKNPHEVRMNLKASSTFFPRSSSWHRLGKRAFWDGEGFAYRNVNFRLEEPENADRQTYNIAFRCMREL
jgi:hypothetical protein